MDKFKITVDAPDATVGEAFGIAWVKIPSPHPEVPTRWYRCDDVELWYTEAGVELLVRGFAHYEKEFTALASRAKNTSVG